MVPLISLINGLVKQTEQSWSIFAVTATRRGRILGIGSRFGNEITMGTKSNRFSAVKKALAQGSKEKKGLKLGKSKRKWFGKKESSDPSLSYLESILPSSPPAVLSHQETAVPTLPITSSEEVNPTVIENEQAQLANSVAIATAKAEEAAAAAAEAAEEVARVTAATAPPSSSGKSKEELAALKIQTAFRKYLARRALLALKGLARLKTLMQAQSLQHQTTATIKAMQTLVRLQSDIRLRRLKMAEDNLARQRQLLLKHTKETGAALQIVKDWDDSVQTRDQIEARLSYRQEAAVRRERAMAYAFSHQQTWRKQVSSSTNTMFLDQNNPYWSWSWLERWLAAKPWETATVHEKEPNDDAKSTKRTSIGKTSTKPQAKTQYDHKPTRAVARSSFSSIASKTASPKSVPRKIKSPKSGSPRTSIWEMDNDSKSITSIKSDQGRRHSIAGSPIRDEGSLGSSPAGPSYMTPAAWTRAKSRLGSPSNIIKDETRTPDRASVSSAKKKLSYTSSPAMSRHSASSITEAF
ncbi:IQ-DOMAIN 2-like protein [Drosera capensis]